MVAISVIMSLTCFALPAFATEASGSFEGTDITWTFDSDTGVVEIAGNGDLPIAKLTETPWAKQTDIKKVVIGDGITSTGKYAFALCTGLESVEISANSSLTTIGAAAFNGCTQLSSMTLPASLQSIQASSFANTSISFGEIPAGCVIATSAIPKTCSYTVNDAMLSSGSYVCNSGSGYTCTYKDGSLTIGLAGETSPNAFYQSIVTFMINGRGIEATDVTSIDFEQGGSITSLGSYTNLESVNIGADITEISVGAFDGLSNLKTATFAEGCQLTSIGSAAFRNCSSLTSIDFSNCTKLTLIGDSDGTMSTGSSPFQNSGLTSIVFPSSLETLGGYAFNGCTALETVDLSGTKLKTIVKYAFNTCTSLTTIKVPATVKTFDATEAGFKWPDKTVEVVSLVLAKPSWAAALEEAGATVSYTLDFVTLTSAASGLKYGDTFTVAVDEAALTAAMSATFTESTNLKLVKVEKGTALAGDGLNFVFTEDNGMFSFIGNEGAEGTNVAIATFECVGTGDATVGLSNILAGLTDDPTEYELATPDALQLYIALKGLKGDLNNNGKVNIVDAQVAYDLARGVYDEDSASESLVACWSEQSASLDAIKEFADVNADGTLDAADAFAIQYAVHNGEFAAA